MTTQQDILNQIEYSRLEGLAEGKLEGLAEGEKKGKAERNMEIAKAMKAKGMSIADIMEITGLAADALARLQ